ncbi:hypothetical protein DM860_010815 [Cuscuta australis]|uniref:Ferritin n=1 Tax=Cuscuta australis TaxID=267555 RepID=A0A328E494_9ASTE|nr:hypothetical protein DM860_010815 [Cuscuta australis]
MQSTLLKAAPAFHPSHSHGDKLSPLFSNASPSTSRLPANTAKNALAVCASKGANNKPVTGVLFEPFEEVKKEHMLVPTGHLTSLARQVFVDECESAINEQINVEYNVSYVYHAMFAYFDRDNVALKGLAKFFKESSDEERDHAEKLMEYQLKSIVMPLSEFVDAEKGDALYAMELALSLEKLTNEKLLNLHATSLKASSWTNRWNQSRRYPSTWHS